MKQIILINPENVTDQEAEGYKVREAARAIVFDDNILVAEILEDLGTVLEYRKKYMLRQRSYCYIAKLVGKKGTPNLMDDEVEEGFQTVWLTLDEALEKVSGSSIKVYEAQYMVARDKAFLEAVVKKSGN